MLDKAVRYPWDSGNELFSSRMKRKPPNQRVRRLIFPLFRWWLCSMETPKQHQAVLGGTKTRAQKPVTVIPTLSRSYAEVPFQLTSVWSSASTVLPPNPTACLRIGVWGKPWDKYSNYFETASPQFRFLSRGQKREGFEVLKRPLPNQAARWNYEIPSPRLGPSVPKRLRNPRSLVDAHS